MRLNRGNFLIWDGEFDTLSFDIQAIDDDVTITVIQTSIIISVLANDIATLGFNYHSVVITLQDNLQKPSVVNQTDGTITYYPSANAPIGDRIIKYKFKDLMGNESNEATVTIHIVPRPTGWRPYPQSFLCLRDADNLRTGYGFYTTIQKYYTDDQTNVIPIQLKPNISTDPDYEPPFLATSCPVEFKTGLPVSVTSPQVSAGNSCSLAVPPNLTTFYTETGQLGLGVTIYLTQSLNPNARLGGPGFVSDGTYSYEINDHGVIIGITECPSHFHLTSFDFIIYDAYGGTMSDAPVPYNQSGYIYFWKNLSTGHYCVSLFFKWVSPVGPGPSVFYHANGINLTGQATIARMSEPAYYPPANIPLSGYGKEGRNISGHIDTNGYIWITNSADKAITSYNPSTPTAYMMRLYNQTYISEFSGLGIVI